MRVAANLGTLFTEVPLVQRYEQAAAAGFRLVEVPFPYSVPPEQLKAAADRFGLRHVLINSPCGDFAAGERGIAANPACTPASFQESVLEALRYAKLLGCSKVHVMAGLVPVSPEATSTFKRNLAMADTLLAKESVQLLIEPINAYSIPDYFLSAVPQAIDCLDGLANAKLLFDVFHVQQMHGQLTPLLQKYAEKIGHIQVAQVPHRHEPDSSGELDYHYVFDVLRRTNPNWIVGCEYLNQKHGKETTDWVVKYGLEF